MCIQNRGSKNNFLHNFKQNCNYSKTSPQQCRFNVFENKFKTAMRSFNFCFALWVKFCLFDDIHWLAYLNIHLMCIGFVLIASAVLVKFRLLRNFF